MAINKVEKNSITYDINDSRISVTSANIGKYLKVKDDLSLEWAEVQGGSGGTQLYKHTFMMDLGSQGSGQQVPISVVTTKSTAYTALYDDYTTEGSIDYDNGVISWLANFTTFTIAQIDSTSIIVAAGADTFTIYVPEAGFVDTVTAL